MFALRVPTAASIGFLAGLKGFTAAVIGGIGSIPGAMAGGLILGLAEAYTAGYVTTTWSDLAIFSRPDRLHAVPAERAVRPGGHQQGMSEPPRPDEQPAGPAIGQDEWVARHGERRAGRRARRQDRGAPARAPWYAWLILFVGRLLAAAARLRHRLRAPRRVRHGALHAARARPQRRRRLGRPARPRLRRVLRRRRLRYAMLDSDQLGVHLPTLVSIPLVVIIGARVGLPGRPALETPGGRLPGDRDAVLPADLPDGRDERRLDLRSQPDRRATDPAPSTPCTSSATTSSVQHQGIFAVSYLYVAIIVFAVVYAALHFVNHSRTGARGGRCARTARGRGDGHAGQPAQADGLQLRRRRRRPHRHIVRLAERECVPAHVLVPRC